MDRKFFKGRYQVLSIPFLLALMAGEGHALSIQR